MKKFHKLWARNLVPKSATVALREFIQVACLHVYVSCRHQLIHLSFIFKAGNTRMQTMVACLSQGNYNMNHSCLYNGFL